MDMTPKEKAQAYDEVINCLKSIIDNTKKQGHIMVRIEDIENNIPELKDNENERISKDLMEWFEEFPDKIWRGHYKKDILDWLERQGELVNSLSKGLDNAHERIDELIRKNNELCIKLESQGEIDKTSYEIAEKEKREFVSGQFIECRKSFNEFKEDNSYWLEYLGNDTYIGRSDNILNKEFHITPRQLYRLFTQEHSYKEDNANEETNAPTAYGKYVDECLNEASKHFFSKGEDAYSVADLFYAGVRCGKSWFEKQGKEVSSIQQAYELGYTEGKRIERKNWIEKPKKMYN